MRKKFTMLLASLLCCMGVMKAQWTGKAIESVSTTPITELKDGFYVLYNNGRGTFLNSEGALGQAKVTWPTSTTYTGVEALNSSEDLTNASGTTIKNAYVFYANVENATVSLQTGYGDYVPVLTGNGVFNYVDTEAFWNYNLKTEGSSSYVFLYGETKALDCNGWTADTHTYSTAAGWDKDASYSVVGNQSWTLYEVVMKEVPTANVTYKYYAGETLLGEETTEVTIGASYPAANYGPDYVVTLGVPEGTVTAEGGTYDIQCSLSSDFPFSTTEYFGLTTRGGAKWLIGTDDDQALTTIGLSIANVADADTYSWIVEGTWYDGFYFKSKKANKYLAVSTANPSNGTETVLTETKGDLAKFAIDLKNGKYYIRIFGTDNNCVSDYGGAGNTSLKTWNSSANYGDAGSQFAVVSIDTQSLLNAFKNDNASCVGCVGGYDVSADEINALTLETVGDFIANNEKIALSEGYYFIKGSGTGNNANRYATYGSNNSDFVAKALADGEKLGAKHVWSFDAINGEDGYKLKSCNLGKYAQLIAAPSTSLIVSDYDNGYKFSFTNNGAGKHIIKDGNNNVMRTENGGEINYWSGEMDETWYLVPVTELEITISEFASICMPFDVVPGEGVKAYAIEGTNATQAILVEKADIPAGEGAILEGTGTVTLNLATATSDWTENLLEGTTVDTYVATVSYVLANGTKGIGLYKAALNKDENGEKGETHFKNNANKAYLPAPANASAPMFSFGRGEGTTGIDNAQLVNDNVVIYDLTGRRVQQMEKGIYIVNGKKVVK